jgi:hypothetical protein
MVAELNFGFWASLFGRRSHHLWQDLRPIFQTRGVQRNGIAQRLDDFRALRNRVAHYEPLLALPLAQRYADITTLTGWLSPSAAAWINENVGVAGGVSRCTDLSYRSGNERDAGLAGRDRIFAGLAIGS